MTTTDPDTRLPIAPLDTIQYEALVRQELAVDLGSAGDITTNAIVGADVTARARVVARQDGRICGLGPALCAFFLLGQCAGRNGQQAGQHDVILDSVHFTLPHTAPCGVCC